MIRGGKRTLGRASAGLVGVNLDILYKGQTSFQEFLVRLEELGLTYVESLKRSLAREGHIAFIDALFVTAPADEFSV